jgi:hypothetical protein
MRFCGVYLSVYRPMPSLYGLLKMTIVEQTKSALIHKSHIINRVNLKKVQEHCSNAS